MQRATVSNVQNSLSVGPSVGQSVSGLIIRLG